MIVLKVVGWLLLGILLLLAFILLLLCFAIRLHVSYLKGEAAVTAHFLFLRLRLFPQKEKPDKPPKAAKKKKPKPEKEATEEPAPEKKKSSLGDMVAQYRPLLRTARVTLRKLCKRLIIYRVEAGVDVGGEDAHKTALTYARVGAFGAILMELLGELFTFRKKYIRISPDFIGETITINISLRIRIRPIFLLIAGVRLFFGYLGAQSYHKEKQKRKGGQQNESAASNR